MPSEKPRITLRPTPEQQERWQAMAKKRGQPLNALLVEAVERGLAEPEKRPPGGHAPPPAAPRPTEPPPKPPKPAGGRRRASATACDDPYGIHDRAARGMAGYCAACGQKVFS